MLKDLSYMLDIELQKLKTDVTKLGLSVLPGGARTTDVDNMQVNFL